MSGDTSLAGIKTALETLGKTVHDEREALAERITAIEKGDTSRAKDLEQQLDRISTDVSAAVKAREEAERELKFQRERLDELEARQDQPGMKKLDQLNDDHEQAFEKALRGQFGNVQANSELKDQESRLAAFGAEQKAVTIATGAAGGFAVPESIDREIEKLERKMSPVRDLVQVIPVSTSDFKKLVSLGGAASGWVGESGSRSETATPTLREVTPTHGELYAYPQASEWSLDDAFFSIADWLRDEVAEEFAYQEGVAVINGDGSNKPTGMLNTTPVTTADGASPLRAAAAYQYIASAASPDALLPDSLIDVVYALNKKYRAGAQWAFNSTVAGSIRKLTDSQNQYLWQPGLQAGEPDRLLGYPTNTWEDMDDVGANTFPVAFGNFRRAYMLVVRVGVRITVDQVTNPGFVRYYIRRREGGIPLNNDALKFIRTT